MRRTTVGLLTAGTLVVAGCGGGTHFANEHRPPTAIDLTVYINDHQVSVSPAAVGAGPVIFLVTNQASTTESLSINSGGSQLASTGPINPGAPAQLKVDFKPGEYLVTTGPRNGSDAAIGSGNAIVPARLHIGAPRPNADDVLLQP
jgi:hypothetical protein